MCWVFLIIKQLQFLHGYQHFRRGWPYWHFRLSVVVTFSTKYKYDSWLLIRVMSLTAAFDTVDHDLLMV